MVLPPGSSVSSPNSTAMTSPKRFNGPHKFTLKWGSRRLLGCTTDNAANAASGRGHRRSPPESTVTLKKRKKVEPDRDESCSTATAASPILHDLEETREKLMHDLRTSVERMRDAIFQRKEEEEEQQQQQQQRPEESILAVTATPALVRSWNILRIRLSAASADAGGSGNGLKNDERKRDGSSSLPARADVAAVKVGERKMRSSSDKAEAERVKFSVSLTKEEIEEDFMKMMGRRRLPRRPKKRPKALQKELDTLVPGLCLTEITADSYKVRFPNPPWRFALGRR